MKSGIRLGKANSVILNRTAAKKGGKNPVLLLYALPFIIFIFLFRYIPLYGWIYSLFEYKVGVPLDKVPFVGLKFYKMIISDSGDVIRIVRNTLVFFFLANVVAAPLPVAFAIMITEVKNFRFRRILQTFSTLPHFVSWVILYSMAFALFSIDGLVNQVLLAAGIFKDPSNLLANPDAVWIFQTLISIWKSLGWGAIIYIAAISSIDQSLYDAAYADGAGRLRSIWHITIPGIMPTFIVLLLLSIGAALGGFDQYFVFRNNVTADNIEVVDVYVYRMGLLLNDFPFATAVGVSKTLVSLVLVTTANLFAKKIRGSTII